MLLLHKKVYVGHKFPDRLNYLHQHEFDLKRFFDDLVEKRIDAKYLIDSTTTKIFLTYI